MFFPPLEVDSATDRAPACAVYMLFGSEKVNFFVIWLGMDIISFGLCVIFVSPYPYSLLCHFLFLLFFLCLSCESLWKQVQVVKSLPMADESQTSVYSKSARLRVQASMHRVSGAHSYPDRSNSQAHVWGPDGATVLLWHTCQMHKHKHTRTGAHAQISCTWPSA